MCKFEDKTTKKCKIDCMERFDDEGDCCRFKLQEGMDSLVQARLFALEKRIKELEDEQFAVSAREQAVRANIRRVLNGYVVEIGK